MTDRELTADSDVGQIRFDPNGLVPVVAQDAVTGRVLMVAWANRDAVEWSLETGTLHFWSRSRGMLWKKGETSGNVLEVRSMHMDCDADTLLAMVDPRGPACHTGEVSCFGTASAAATGQALVPEEADPAVTAGMSPVFDVEHRAVSASPGVLAELWDVIVARRSSDPSESYTARLLSDRNLAAKKLGEEVAEVVMAFAERDPVGLASEGADLLYHLMVTLAAGDTTFEAVLAELARRRG